MGSTLKPFSTAAGDVNINDGQFNHAHQIFNHHHHEIALAESKALVELSRHCAFGAFLNAIERADPFRCSPNTRVLLLGEMKGWATGEEQISSAMWLTGSAGSGKTALSQTTAEDLKEEGRVLGCHFFWRTSKDGKRSDGYCWVPNMVHQMIRVLPKTLRFVEKEIRSNDSLIDQQPDSVFDDLFLSSLLKAFPPPGQRFSFRGMFRQLIGRSKMRVPLLIVIDGLDECKTAEMQVLILQTIAKAIPKLPIPVRFLIASRPETHIKRAINQLFNQIPLHRINLDEDQDIRKDLEAYYTDRFDQIRREHPSLRGQEVYADWPSKDAVDILVTKSSTQFIFASTVMNYISHHRYHPVTRLEVILGEITAPCGDRPFSALDTLYTVILRSVEEENLRIVRLILTLIYLAGKGEYPELNLVASPEFLDDFLDLRFGDVARLLDPLVSLLTVPEAPSGVISMLHASFFDYFRDPDRSEGLVMQFGDAHEVTAANLFRPIMICQDVYSRISATMHLKDFLNHALHATTSTRLILMLYGLEDDLGHEYTHQLMSATPTRDFVQHQGDLRSYMLQISDLLCSKLGIAREMMVDTCDDSSLSSFERRRENMATMIVQRALRGQGLGLALLFREIFNTKGLDVALMSLSKRSCIPLLKQILQTELKMTWNQELSLIQILQEPVTLEPWVSDLAQDVLKYLDKVDKNLVHNWKRTKADWEVYRNRETKQDGAALPT